MTQQVSDETLGKFAREQNDWFRRVREGSLDPDDVARVVQQIIDCPFKMDKIKADIIHAYHRSFDIIRNGVLDYIEMVIGTNSSNLKPGQFWKYTNLDGSLKTIVINFRYINAIEVRLGLRNSEIKAAFRQKIMDIRKIHPNYDFMDNHDLVRAVTENLMQGDITNSGFFHIALGGKDRSKENLDIYNRVLEGLIKQGYSKTEAEKAIERFCSNGN